jgi:hypothetical protein
MSDKFNPALSARRTRKKRRKRIKQLTMSFRKVSKRASRHRPISATQPAPSKHDSNERQMAGLAESRGKSPREIGGRH